MNPDLIRIAESNQWFAIFPEIQLGCLALALLVVEMILPKKEHESIPYLSVAGQLGILVGVFLNYRTVFLGETTFGGMLQHSAAGQFMRVFFILT
jgi:NADH-quinone oxidoreductase subunit N